MLKQLLTIVSFLIPFAALADSSLKEIVVDHIVAEYLQNTKVNQSEVGGFQNLLQMANFSNRPDHGCRDDKPPRNGCIDAVCEKLGQYGCDSLSEVKQVGEICVGNRNGSCVKSVCEKLGAYGCDNLNEVKSVAEMCRGVKSGDCLNVVCEHLGPYGCDNHSEVKNVTEICKNTEASCISSVCERVGPYGCDAIDELKKVASACRGE